jgi:hypothetical protein
MANVNVVKRTKQLADAREVVVSHAADGTPIWTYAGELSMQGSDNDKLRTSLAAQKRAARVHRAMKEVQAARMQFVEHVINHLADQSLDVTPCVDFSTLTFKFDGFHTAACLHGKVIAEVDAKHVPHDIAADVLMELRKDAANVILKEAARQ